MEVLFLAEKYLMPFLVEKCRNFIKDKVEANDVLSILPQAQKIGDEELEYFLDRVNFDNGLFVFDFY